MPRLLTNPSSCTNPARMGKNRNPTAMPMIRVTKITTVLNFILCSRFPMPCQLRNSDAGNNELEDGYAGSRERAHQKPCKLDDASPFP